jgi:hypothetical protein
VEKHGFLTRFYVKEMIKETFWPFRLEKAVNKGHVIGFLN